jgi:hypothetical protein
MSLQTVHMGMHLAKGQRRRFSFNDENKGFFAGLMSLVRKRVTRLRSAPSTIEEMEQLKNIHSTAL